MSSMGTDLALFHSFQGSIVRDLGQDLKRCRKSSCPVSISMSENVSINLSSYTNSKLLYPRFFMSLKKCVFGLQGSCKAQVHFTKMDKPGPSQIAIGY